MPGRAIDRAAQRTRNRYALVALPEPAMRTRTVTTRSRPRALRGNCHRQPRPGSAAPAGKLAAHVATLRRREPSVSAAVAIATRNDLPATGATGTNRAESVRTLQDEGGSSARGGVRAATRRLRDALALVGTERGAGPERPAALTALSRHGYPRFRQATVEGGASR